MNIKKELKKELLKIEVKKVDYLLSELAIHKGKLPIDSPLPYEDALAGLLTNDFNTVFAAHLKNLVDTGELDILFSLYYTPDLPLDMVEQQLAGLVDRLSEPFDVAWAYSHKKEITEMARI